MCVCMFLENVPLGSIFFSIFISNDMITGTVRSSWEGEVSCMNFGHNTGVSVTRNQGE